MKLLELFSGTGSVNKVAKKLGYEVISVDITDKFGHTPTHLIDIMKWDYKKYKVGYFDIIWSSVPCRTFSSMLFMTKTKLQVQKMMETEGLPLLNKTLEIINYFQPRYYFIENPDGGRMKDYLDYLPFYRVSYCRYGFPYRKNTRIWTNKIINNLKFCNHKGKHSKRIGATRKTNGDKFKSEDKNYIKSQNLKLKYGIPEKLIYDLIVNAEETTPEINFK